MTGLMDMTWAAISIRYRVTRLQARNRAWFGPDGQGRPAEACPIGVWLAFNAGYRGRDGQDARQMVTERLVALGAHEGEPFADHALVARALGISVEELDGYLQGVDGQSLCIPDPAEDREAFAFAWRMGRAHLRRMEKERSTPFYAASPFGPVVNGPEQVWLWKIQAWMDSVKGAIRDWRIGR